MKRKAVQRKAGHAERWADDSADRRGEREFENALWPIKDILATREAVHQPCAGYGLKCVAGRDGNRCGDIARGREVYQERTHMIANTPMSGSPEKRRDCMVQPP